MASYLRSGLSRRSFLLGATSLAASAAAAAASKSAYARGLPANCGVCDPDERAWRHLGQQLQGYVLRPGDPGYAAAALPNNLRYACILPRGIARCRTRDDIAAAISWCRDYDMPFAVRAGGHSYAGYSTTYGLMLDVSPMRQISFDRSTGLVTVAGGARNTDVYAALRANNVAITHGRCPSVGAAAFLLGGGIGFNMRRKGLASDQLVQTELVTADGVPRVANAASNADLFWACRGGGGGNFGVSTSFTLQTFPTSPLTVFSLEWSRNPESVAKALMPILEKAPETLGSRASLAAVTPAQRAQGKDVTVNLLGQIVGTSRDLLDILSPLPVPDKVNIRETGYWEGQDFLHEEGDPTYYQERSAFVVQPLGDNALAEGFRWLRSWPGTAGYCDLRFFQTGGAMNRVPPTATAFAHRNSRWLMVVGLYWDAQDDASPDVMRRAHDWQNGFYQAMLPFTGRGAYVNFPDPSLADWRRAYYGANFDALAKIKAAVDPTNIFQFPQAL
jgi:FAD/FMN-containing dehydrogenase